jgi:hypothetical protein
MARFVRILIVTTQQEPFAFDHKEGRATKLHGLVTLHTSYEPFHTNHFLDGTL